MTEPLEARCLLAVGSFIRLDGIPPGGVPTSNDLAAAENTHALAIYDDFLTPESPDEESEIPDPPNWQIESTDGLLAYAGRGVNAAVTDAMASATTQAVAEVPTPIGNSIAVPQVSLAAIQMAMGAAEDDFIDDEKVSVGDSHAGGTSEAILYTPFQFQAPAGQEANPFLYRGFIHIAAGGIVSRSAGMGDSFGSVNTEVPFPLNYFHDPDDPPPTVNGMRVWLGTTLLAEAYIEGDAHIVGTPGANTGLWALWGQVRELDGSYTQFSQSGSSAQAFIPFSAKIFDGNVITYDADPNRTPFGMGSDWGGIGGNASASSTKHALTDSTITAQAMTLQVAGAWGFADPFVNPPPTPPPPQTGNGTPPGDINGDGVVDQNDFNVLAQDIAAWGQGDPSRLKDWMKAQVEASQGDAFIVTNATDEDDGDDTYYDLSLREALSLAQDGDKIYVAPWVHDILLTNGQLSVTEDVQIVGSGADWLRLDGGGSTRVLNVGSGVTASVSGLTIKRGYTTGDGGGIYSTGKLTLDSVEVVDNDAGQAGGGVFQSGGSLQVTRSTIAENTAVGEGGGVYMKTPSGQIEKSTFSGNQGLSGGGVFIGRGNSTITFKNVTVTGNHITALKLGGGIYNQPPEEKPSAVVRLDNTIVVGNTNSLGNNNNLGGEGAPYHASSSYNLIGAGATFPSGNGNQLNVTPAQAALGPLANNGGTTRTHALLTGSWALDRGSNVIAGTQDQRGHTRPIDLPLVPNGTGGAADIGAYEYEPIGGGSIALTATPLYITSSSKATSGTSLNRLHRLQVDLRTVDEAFADRFTLRPAPRITNREAPLNDSFDTSLLTALKRSRDGGLTAMDVDESIGLIGQRFRELANECFRELGDLSQDPLLPSV